MHYIHRFKEEQIEHPVEQGTHTDVKLSKYPDSGIHLLVKLFRILKSTTSLQDKHYP